MRRLMVVIAVVSLLVVVGVARLGWATIQSWQDSHHGCDIPVAPAAAVSASSDKAPDSGEVKVVEQGFTDHVNGGASLGAVLHNAGGSVAYGTTVGYRIYDAQGHLIPALAQPQLIPVMLPGDRVGIGQFIGTTMSIGSFEVEVGVSRWVPQDTLGKHLTAVTGTGPRTDRNTSIPWLANRITFTETSANCRDLQYGPVATIFRNHAGAIVGGSNDLPWGVDADLCRRGRTTLSLRGLVVPVTADDMRTEVYPYCSLAPKPLPSPSV